MEPESLTYDETLGNLFQLIDINKDGVLSKIEILKAVTTHSSKIETILASASNDLSGLQVLLIPRKLEVFFSFATAEPGKATSAEFALFARQRALHHILEEIFQLIDGNGDGKLSKSELTARRDEM